MIKCKGHVTGEISIFTGRNEVVAKVMFLHVCVILFTGGSASVHAGRPLGRRPPGKGTPREGGTPWEGGTPQEGDPPEGGTPRKETPWKEAPPRKETPGKEAPP